MEYPLNREYWLLLIWMIYILGIVLDRILQENRDQIMNYGRHQD